MEKLTSVEISMLHALDGDKAEARPSVRHADIPKRLFEFSLVARQPAGEMVMTKVGQRALFQHQCVQALQGLVRGEGTQLSSGVERWLVASGFVAQGAPGLALQVTARGTLWLTSLGPDVLTEQVPAPTAAQFASRRSVAS